MMAENSRKQTELWWFEQFEQFEHPHFVDTQPRAVSNDYAIAIELGRIQLPYIPIQLA